MPTFISHPVPQYGQVVVVLFVGTPRARMDLSSNAPVGQVSTHAPQFTHELSRKFVCQSGTILVTTVK
ncbi:MAG TPA: hypothetical protein VGP81_14660 [Pyrinomonadaceae bacterium]|nr:hypothetical protein [Pyrinomonadaceae bacterium]